MELQQNHADFERAGVAVFAISYDAIDVLKQFSQRHGVTFTLLSDEGSQVIKRLGLLNAHIEQHQAYYGLETKPYHYGVPYPGTFILDEAGTILEKRFEQIHRPRPSPVALLDSVGGQNSRQAAMAQAENEHLRVMASFGQSAYRPWQRLRLSLDIQVKPGLHVFGGALPEDYTPLSVEVEATEPVDALEVGPLQLPEPLPYRIEGLDERLFIYEAHVRGALLVTVPTLVDEVTFTLRLRYQACAETVCYPPAELPLRLSLRGLDVVRD